MPQQALVGVGDIATRHFARHDRERADAVVIGERIGDGVFKSQLRAETAREVFVGDAGERTRVDRHIGDCANAAQLLRLARAQVARVMHFDHQVLDAARIAREFLLAPASIRPVIIQRKRPAATGPRQTSALTLHLA